MDRRTAMGVMAGGLIAAALPENASAAPDGMEFVPEIYTGDLTILTETIVIDLPHTKYYLPGFDRYIEVERVPPLGTLYEFEHRILFGGETTIEREQYTVIGVREVDEKFSIRFDRPLESPMWASDISHYKGEFKPASNIAFHRAYLFPEGVCHVES